MDLSGVPLKRTIDYLNIPVLDHSIPTHSQLNQAINWIHHYIKEDRRVVVHCALRPWAVCFCNGGLFIESKQKCRCT